MSANKQKELWEKLAKKNAKYYIMSDHGHAISDAQFYESARQDFERLIVGDPLLPKGGLMLDIGCGIGRLDGLLSVFYDVVIGIDISGEMIKQGRERLKSLPNVQLIETDGVTIPGSDSTIDVAFSYLVFQHMKTDEMIRKNFDEVFRVLRSGGIFKVLLRSDNVDVEKWWGGVTADETYPVSIGFQLLKKEAVSDYGLWLWLKKP